MCDKCSQRAERHNCCRNEESIPTRVLSKLPPGFFLSIDTMEDDNGIYQKVIIWSWRDEPRNTVRKSAFWLKDGEYVSDVG